MTDLVGYRDYHNWVSGCPGEHIGEQEFYVGRINLVKDEVYPLLIYISTYNNMTKDKFKVRTHYPDGEWNDGGIEGVEGEWKFMHYDLMPADMSPTGGLTKTFILDYGTGISMSGVSYEHTEPAPGRQESINGQLVEGSYTNQKGGEQYWENSWDSTPYGADRRFGGDPENDIYSFYTEQ